MTDGEAIVTTQLAEDEVVSSITSEVVGTTPDEIAGPWVRVTLMDDYATDGRAVDHLTHATLQIDCFAGTAGSQEAASDLSMAVVSALRALPDSEAYEGVVTAVETRRRRMDDLDFTPPMTRYIVTADVWSHP